MLLWKWSNNSEDLNHYMLCSNNVVNKSTATGHIAIIYFWNCNIDNLSSVDSELLLQLDVVPLYTCLLVRSQFAVQFRIIRARPNPDTTYFVFIVLTFDVRSLSWAITIYSTSSIPQMRIDWIDQVIVRQTTSRLCHTSRMISMTIHQ